MGNSKLKRVQIDMPPEAYQRLDELREAMSAGTIAETIRRAIEIGERVTDYLNDGYDIMAEKEGDKPRPLYAPAKVRRT
jgi:predicted DNA-binding protein